MILWGWILLMTGVSPLAGQIIRVGDSARVRLFLFKNRPSDTVSGKGITGSAEYALNASLYSFLNSTGSPQKGNLVLFHSLRSFWRSGGPGPVFFSGAFIHRLGVQCFFDSLMRISADENTLRVRLEVRARRWVGYTLDSDLSTGLLNGYEASQGDSGQWISTLKSAFLTPMILNFSLGVCISIPQTASLLLGISGGKFTVVRDHRVFEGMAVPLFYGVPEGSSCLFEYGLSMKFLLDRTFRGFFRWNGDFLLFKNFTRPVDINLRNSFEFRVAKYFLLSLQTRVVYESAVSCHVRLENLVSAGFSVRF